MGESVVAGIPEFRADLAAGMQRQRQALREKMEQLGMQITAEIRVNAPVVTGATQRSVRYVVVDTATGEKLEIKVGDATAYYVGFIEYGSAHAAAHPFVRPVVYRHEKTLPAALSEGVEKAWS